MALEQLSIPQSPLDVSTGDPNVYIECREDSFAIFNVSQSDVNLIHLLMILAALIVHKR